jgi:hypothetical protein
MIEATRRDLNSPRLPNSPAPRPLPIWCQVLLTVQQALAIAVIPLAIEYSAGPVTADAAQLAPWHGRASADVLTLDGPCPACEHPTENQIPRRFSALERVGRLTPQPLSVQLACTCTEEHPGRPPEVSSGCGRTWFAVAVIADDGTATLAPPSASADPTLEAAARALIAAGPKQLADVRNAAEKWIGGVTALFGIFGVASVVGARSTLTGLAPGWQAVIGIATALSVGLAGLAVYWIYRAAYGWPVTYPINNDQELLAWYASQQSAPRAQAAFLKEGVRAAGGALVMLVITVGLLWYAPQQSPMVPLVQVTLSNGSQVCGTLLPATPGATLVRRASDGTAVDITARSIVAETVVTAC